MNEQAIEYSIEDLPDDGLAAVAESAKALKAAYKEKERLEDALKLIAADVLRIETQELPAAMKALGVTAWTLSSGDSITLKEEVHAEISGPKESAAFAWLRTTGNESLIKRAITIAFGKGEDETASALVEQLREALPDNELVDKAAVNHNTLKAFVKERIELEKVLQPVPNNPQLLRNDDGDLFEKIPRDVFGIFIIDRAKIKSPKAKKEK
jgi:hypothetical protein